MFDPLASMDFKFSPKDIITGKAEKVGDEFTANAFGGVQTFKVTEVSSRCIFARMVSK